MASRGAASPHSAIRVGDPKLLKLYEDDSVRFFDLAADSGERRNLVPELPARASALAKTRRQWPRDAAAVIPNEANPAYNPRGRRATW